MFPIERLIPHQPPMRLLDALSAYDDKSATCRVKLDETSTFMRQGRMNALVAIEYLAQTVAAYATLHSGGDPLAKEGDPPKPRIGYLVGVRRLELMVDHFFPGDELIICVTHVWGEDQGAQFRGNITRDGTVVATATLTVFVPPDDHKGDA